MRMMRSSAQLLPPNGVRCTRYDRYNAVLYQHRLITQAAAAADGEGNSASICQTAC